MDTTLDIEVADDQSEPEQTAVDDERIALIADELREAIRRKVSQIVV
jgi:hypothetical protein